MGAVMPILILITMMIGGAVIGAVIGFIVGSVSEAIDVRRQWLSLDNKFFKICSVPLNGFLVGFYWAFFTASAAGFLCVVGAIILLVYIVISDPSFRNAIISLLKIPWEYGMYDL